MKLKRDLLLVFGSFVVYMLAFQILYPIQGQIVGAYMMFPVLVGSLLFGMRGGIICGMLTAPANIILFNSVHSDVNPPHVRLIMLVLMSFLGALVGYLKDLRGALQREVDLRKEKEAELHHALKNLEESHAAILEAEKTRAVCEMAAVMVHDLAQPLTGIKGFTGMLAKDIQSHLLSPEIKLDPTSILNDLDVIASQTQRMYDIVKEIGKLSISEQKKFIDVNGNGGAEKLPEVLITKKHENYDHNSLLQRKKNN